MDTTNYHKAIPLLFFAGALFFAAFLFNDLMKMATPGSGTLLAQVGGGTTYYACDCGSGAASGCSAGSDTNAGTSSSAPLRTYDALQGKMTGSSCGTQFLFCQGGSFNVAGGSSWSWSGTTDCSANPKIIGSYNAGFSSVRPQTRQTGAGHAFNIGSTPSLFGITIRDLEIICTDAFETGCNGGSGAGVGVYLASAARATIDNVVIDNFTIGLQTAGYTPAPPSYILRNSTIKNSQEFGILGHVGNDTQVLDSTFDGNTRCRGSECGFNRTFYITPNGYNNFTFARNTVTNWGADQDAGGACNSNAGHVRGGNNVLVEDNTFTAKTSPLPTSICSGIRVYGFTDGARHVCDNCTVRRNRFNNVSAAISIGSWLGGTIENNAISSPSYGASGVPVQGIVIEPKQETIDQDVTGVTIRNNSIYLENKGANTYTGINLQTSEGSGFIFTNNAIQLQGDSSTARCFSTPVAADVSVENNNICSTGSSGRYISNASTGQSLATWRSATGQGSASQEGLPGFTSPGSPAFNFQLLANALAVNAGSGTYAASNDISGSSRPQGSDYDVGAYEVGGGTPPPTQTCGNNIREGTEVCDGTDRAGQTCQSQGFTGGTLSCNASCTQFVTSACTGGPTTISTLTFEPRMEGRSAVGQTFSFVMRDETTNTQVGSITTTTNAQGQVILTGQSHDASHLYFFTITSTNFLRRVMRNVTLSTAPIVMPQLLAGDLNATPDQVINSLDWSVMSNQWGTNNTLSDINRDGVVNSIDFSYLNKNWMQVGE